MTDDIDERWRRLTPDQRDLIFRTVQRAAWKRIEEDPYSGTILIFMTKMLDDMMKEYEKS